MPLKLAVPAIEPSSNLTLETRPRQVQEWLATLSFSNPSDTSRTLCDALYSLNRYKISHDNRLKLLELYAGTLAELFPALEQQFSRAPSPLPEKSRQIAVLARELYIELAYGYKLILVEQANRLISFGSNKQLPELIHGAITSLSQILVICYETYAPTPAGIWSEIHQLYRLATQNEIQDEKILYLEKPRSINLSYKKALLLALMDPYRLMQGDVTKILDYLNDFGDHATLQPCVYSENPVGLFLVKLDSDKPPKNTSNSNVISDPQTDILLNTVKLARILHDQFLKLKSGVSVKSLKLPEIAREASYHDLMQRMMRHWGLTPKRVYTRSAKNTYTDISIGIRAIYYFLSGEKPLPKKSPPAREVVTFQFTGSYIDKTPQQIISTRWIILNESAGGLGITTSASTPIQVRVGEVIGIRQDGLKSWNVAVVRWLTTKESGELEVGVQMLAPAAKAVLVTPTHRGSDSQFEALLLPEIAALKRPASIIVPRGTFKELRSYTMELDGEKTEIVPADLIEQTPSFDLFHFTKRT